MSEKDPEIEYNRHLKETELLTGWSKWLITLNFSAVTGCTVVLKLGVAKDLVSPLIWAIIFFGGCVLCSAIYVLLLALNVNYYDKSDTSLTGSKKIQIVPFIQLGLFIAGTIAFVIWAYSLGVKTINKEDNPKPQPTGYNRIESGFNRCL